MFLIAGVLATIGVELALIIVASLIACLRGDKKRDSEFEAEKQGVKAEIEKTCQKMEERT